MELNILTNARMMENVREILWNALVQEFAQLITHNALTEAVFKDQTNSINAINYKTVQDYYQMALL